MARDLNDNIKVHAPKPVEAKYFNWLNVWVDEAEAYLWIPSTERHRWLTININWAERRWRDWILDVDLILKEYTPSVDTEENRVSKYMVTSPFQANEIMDLSTWIWSWSWTCNHFGDNIDWTDRNIWASAWWFFDEAWLNVYILWQWETYKSVWVIRDSPTSFHFPVSLNIWDFFRVEKDAWMGSVGQSLANALKITYAEAKVLVDTNSLVPWTRYKIIDFISKNSASTEWDIYTAAAHEPIYLQAISTNWFAQRVYSETYFNDVISYNFNDDVLPWWEFGWERDTGSDTGWDITISNVTPTSFECSMPMYIDEYFELEVEDDNWDSLYSYWTWWENVDWTITYLTWNRCRIDILVPIDLTTPAYNYIYIYGTTVSGSRRWNIIFRRNEDIDWEASFDFRNHWTIRWKADVSWYSAWNSWTAYNYRDIVLHNWDAYVAMCDTTNETPSSFDRSWSLIIHNYIASYCCTKDWLYVWWVTIPRDITSPLMYETLWVYDENTETSTHNLIGIKWFSIMSEDVVVNTQNSTDNVEWLVIEKNCSRITLLGRENSFLLKQQSRWILVNIQSQLELNTSLWPIWDIAFSNYNAKNTFHSFQNSIICGVTYCTIEQSCWQLMLKNCYTSKIGTQTGNFRAWSLWQATVWPWSVTSYFRRIREGNLDKVSNVISYTNDFNFNTFGIYMQNLIIPYWRRFEDNTFLDHFWGQNSSSTLTMDYNFRNNNWWSNVFNSGNSTASQFYFCNMKNNVRNLTFGWNCNYSDFWTNCSNINWTGLNYWDIWKYANNITFGYGNYLNVWKNCSSLNWGSWDVRAVTVEDWVQSIAFWANALSQSASSHNKTITSWESNTKRLSYRDNTWAEQHIDPTT